MNAASSVANSVTPSRRLSSRSPRALAARRPRSAPRRRRCRTAGRGRSTGRSSTGSVAAERLEPVARAAHSSASPVSHRRCQSAKSAYCTGKSAAAAGTPRHERRVEGGELAEHEIQRPAVRGDVVHREREDVLGVRRAGRASFEAWAPRRGRTAPLPSAALRRRSSASRAAAGKPRRSSTAASTSRRAPIRCTGRPSTIGNVARRTSCRVTTASTLRRSASTSSDPLRPTRMSEVVDGAARVQLLQEPHALLAEGQRSARGRRAGAGAATGSATSAPVPGVGRRTGAAPRARAADARSSSRLASRGQLGHDPSGSASIRFSRASTSSSDISGS